MKLLIFGSLFCVALSPLMASAALIDLSTWSVVQYEFFDQPDANWVLSNSNHTATQTVNADASILLSDFDLTDTFIDGSWQVNTFDDDDFMGFVFGYQGRGNYYLFDWKQGIQDVADIGMSIKTVHIPGGADPNYTPNKDFWATNADPSRVTLLKHNTIGWQESTAYDFHLEFHPGQFTITVKEGANVLQTWTVNDNTYTTGKFGFYNYSQGVVVYQGFTQQPAPPPSVPEPGTMTLVGIGAFGLFAGAMRRRRPCVLTSQKDE